MQYHYDVSLRLINKVTFNELENALYVTLSPYSACEMEINCRGGDVIRGLKIVDLIKNSAIPVHSTVVEEAGSMAAVILQCSKIRRMMHTGTLHYHYGSWQTSFLIYFDEKMGKLNRERGIQYQNAMIDPIMARTGMSNKDVHKLLREDRKLSAEEALARGLIDEIIH